MRNSSRPPSGRPSRALLATCRSISSSWPGSARTGSRSGSSAGITSIRLPTMLRIALTVPLTRRLRSSARGASDLAPAEGEQLAGQSGGAVGGLLDPRHVAPRLGRERRVLLQQGDVARGFR